MRHGPRPCLPSPTRPDIRKPATYFFGLIRARTSEKSTRNLESKKKLIPKFIFRRSGAQKTLFFVFESRQVKKKMDIFLMEPSERRHVDIRNYSFCSFLSSIQYYTPLLDISTVVNSGDLAARPRQLTCPHPCFRQFLIRSASPILIPEKHDDVSARLVSMWSFDSLGIQGCGQDALAQRVLWNSSSDRKKY